MTGSLRTVSEVPLLLYLPIPGCNECVRYVPHALHGRELHAARCTASYFARGVLHVARGVLHVARGVLHVARGVLHVARGVLHVARGALHVARGVLFVARGMLRIVVMVSVANGSDGSVPVAVVEAWHGTRATCASALKTALDESQTRP